ncbi:DUF6559 family protein [Alcanivorax sp.]|uniref:DUF6559 family protein n=1 Tax=Alcanivorax sp. TaxID=1872427 RepID=UPI00344D2541
MRKRDSVIQKYQQLLPDALPNRYGGSLPYSPAQVCRTVSDLGLNEHYAEYACLLFCDEKALDPAVFTEEKLSEMREIMASALEKGSRLGPVAGLFAIAVGGAFDSDCGDGSGGGCGE